MFIFAVFYWFVHQWLIFCVMMCAYTVKYWELTGGVRDPRVQ